MGFRSGCRKWSYLWAQNPGRPAHNQSLSNRALVAHLYRILVMDYVGNVTFEVFTAVTMKNAVFCDYNPSSYLTGNTLRLRYRAQVVDAM
jgi:hypothetical protein